MGAGTALAVGFAHARRRAEDLEHKSAAFSAPDRWTCQTCSIVQPYPESYLSVYILKRFPVRQTISSIGGANAFEQSSSMAVLRISNKATARSEQLISKARATQLTRSTLQRAQVPTLLPVAHGCLCFSKKSRHLKYLQESSSEAPRRTR